MIGSGITTAQNFHRWMADHAARTDRLSGCRQERAKSPAAKSIDASFLARSVLVAFVKCKPGVDAALRQSRWATSSPSPAVWFAGLEDPLASQNCGFLRCQTWLPGLSGIGPAAAEPVATVVCHLALSH